MSSSRADWLIFVALSLMWGSSYLFIKIAVDDFGTFTLVALRLAIGAAMLWTVLRVARQPLPRERRVYGHLVVMAVLNIALPFFLITWAERGVESSLAAILTALAPLFVAVLAPFFIHDEPLRANSAAGLALGFVGVVVLTGGGFTPAQTDIGGVLALVAASLSYSIGGVYSRRNVRGLPPMVPAVLQVTFALLITGAIALFIESPWTARPDLSAVFSIVWLGLLGSGLAYLAFFRLLNEWGATRTAAVAYVIPVIGIVLGAIVLGEPIDVRVIAGTGLIIAGVALVNSRYGRRLIFGRGPEAPVVTGPAK